MKQDMYHVYVIQQKKIYVALVHQILGFQTHNINSIFKRCCLIDMIYVDYVVM